MYLAQRYEKSRRYLHATDNSLLTAEESKGNSMYRVQQILHALWDNCLDIEQEENQSLDEQILPGKNKFSGIRQYNTVKPHKWGFSELC